MTTPAYTRLDVDERRRQLLSRGAELFSEHAYEELSMAAIARAAGISKPLLYHYFSSKQELFRATLAEAAEEIRELTEPDLSLPPLQALRGSLEGFVGWVEEHQLAYAKLVQSATGNSDVRELVDRVKNTTGARIVGALYTETVPVPAVRAAVYAWLWYVEGACLDWIEHGDYTRAALTDLLMEALIGALHSAGLTPP